MSSGNEPKRLRFSSDDDLALLREFISQNPLEDVEKWENVQKNVYQITGKKFSIRTLKDHLFLILEIWLRKDADNQKKSGVEEMYSERDHLLQEVSDICGSAKANPSKRKRTVSKEKQISDLGRLAREQCALKLKLEEATTSNEPDTPNLISTDIISDHDYLNNFPAGPSILEEAQEEVIIEETEVPGIELINASLLEINENLPLPQTPSGKMQDMEKVVKKTDQKERVRGPIKSKNNRSASIRKNALDYLNHKEERDRTLKIKELELAEKRLQLEERKLNLEEDRLELESLERKERWEMEKEKIKQELFERNQSGKIIEYQQQLIQSLMARLKKYEEC